jgi:hypothetical protein
MTNIEATSCCRTEAHHCATEEGLNQNARGEGVQLKFTCDQGCDDRVKDQESAPIDNG